MPNTHILTDAVDFTQLVAPASSSTGRTGATYIDMRTFEGAVVLIDVGAMTATGTLDVQVVQATDSSGTGSKNLTGAALTQILAASGGSKLYAIEFRTPQLDLNNGFFFVSVTLTAATAASISGAILIRHRGRTFPVTTSLTQQVKV